MSQCVGRLESVRHGVGVGQFGQRDRLDPFDGDVAGSGDIASLAGAHHSPLPEANRLRLLAATDGREEFFLEQ